MLLAVPAWMESVMDFVKENIVYFCIAIGVLVVAEVVLIAVNVRTKKKLKAEHAAKAAAEEAAVKAKAAAQAAPVKTVAVPVKPAPAAPAVVKTAPAAPKTPAAKKPAFVDPDKDDDLTETRFDEASDSYIVIKYSKSFLAKLIQSKDETKAFYSELKNELLSYQKVKSRASWKHETFRVGRAAAVRMQIRGKTLRLYFALDPAAYAETKYKLEDVSNVAKNADVPALYRVTSARRTHYAKDLVADVMANLGVAKKAEYAPVDYAAEYPYEENEPLIVKELIKVLTNEDAKHGSHFGSRKEEDETEEFAEEVAVAEVPFVEEPARAPEAVLSVPAEPLHEHYHGGRMMREVSVEEVNDLITDEEVEELVVTSERVADRTKRVVVNVDTLSVIFQDGETVTLEELKKRIPSIPKKATFYKVLARGSLSKALIVDADDYSVEAEKMIVVTGGTVLRSKFGD